MGKKFKYATGLWCLGGCADRFVPSGYLDRSYELRELIDIAASVDGITGIEAFMSWLSRFGRLPIGDCHEGTGNCSIS